MNKMVKWAILVCLLMIFAVLPISAEQAYDSIHLDPADRKLLQTHESDTVVKLYNTIFEYKFAQGISVQDIVQKLEPSRHIYLVKSGSGVSFKMLNYGRVSIIDSDVKIGGWKDIYIYAVTPSKALPGSYQVYQTYCLSGASSNHGVFIYYITDHGDWILFKKYLEAKEMYLLPLDKMQTVAGMIEEAEIAGIGNDEEIDSFLADYRFDPIIKLLPIYIIGGTILFAFVGITVIVLIRKKKSIFKND